MINSTAGKFILSVVKSWKSIFILIFTGLALAIGFLYLLSYYARCMAFTSIGLVLVLLFGGGAYLLVAD